MVKINWNVALDKVEGSVGIGITIRDYEGFILAARRTAKNISVELVVAELWLLYMEWSSTRG
jgi:hypothetical protein